MNLNLYDNYSLYSYIYSTEITFLCFREYLGRQLEKDQGTTTDRTKQSSVLTGKA